MLILSTGWQIPAILSNLINIFNYNVRESDVLFWLNSISFRNMDSGSTQNGSGSGSSRNAPGSKKLQQTQAQVDEVCESETIPLTML